MEALLGEEITSVACSDKHVLAVANGNEVFSWGRNEEGCLGLGGRYIDYWAGRSGGSGREGQPQNLFHQK